MLGLSRRSIASEVTAMVLRRRRAAAWILGLGTVPAVLGLAQIEDPAKGRFKVRPSQRAELRAPIAGFLRAVYRDQGERVSPGVIVARLDVADLEARIARKRAEVERARAELRLLEIGARRATIVEQRGRVARARSGRDLARIDLEGLEALRQEDARGRAERTAAEAALAFCDENLADAAEGLTLLEAGSRPEERAAARARLAQLEEEAIFLDGLRARLTIVSPLHGLVVTPRLREKVGRYFREGDLIGEVQAVSDLEAEIALDEGSALRVRAGQAVELRARALAFATLRGQVEQVAPSAVSDEKMATVTVTVRCKLDGPASALKPEMTGYARIRCGPRPIGEILAERLLRFLRTEFWL